MRGKPPAAAPSLRIGGITPADAGKTAVFVFLQYPLRDHPRGCGENAFFANLSRLKPGSPPRMRGKPTVGQTIKVKAGITPADAGKTRDRESVYY